MSSVLQGFIDELPDWLEVIDASDLPASIVLRSDNIGVHIRRVDLLLKDRAVAPSVEELDNSKKSLPDFCYERHIMSDRSFCLGHIEGSVKLNRYELFWRKLKAFLENQDYAARHGVWPIEQGMSHSEISMKAQKLIEAKVRSNEGLLQDWLLSAFRGKGWISDIAHRPLESSEPSFTKRQPCPRGCSNQDPDHAGCKLRLSGKTTRAVKKNAPVLIGDCKDSKLISDVLKFEHIRFSSDQLLYDSILQSTDEGFSCCGSMKTCPMNIGAKPC